MSNETRDQLVQAAREVRELAYAPYSTFQVGAALLCDTGEVFVGCNVENASYGLSLCAERTAVFAAVSNGQRKFRALALATSGTHVPCGACRQVLAEFCGSELLIFIADGDQPRQPQELRLGDLFPQPFRLS